MSDYSKITNFLSKDSLSLNDPAKYVKGSEIDAEYNAIAVAIATKADTASPTLTTPTMSSPTITGTITAAIANFSGLVTAALGLTVSGAAFNSRGITDNATAKALTLSGSGANSVTIANSATNPTIGTSAGALLLAPATGFVQLNGVTTSGLLLNAATGNSALVAMYVNGTEVARIIAGAAENLLLGTSSTGTPQVSVTHTASADRYITLTGSNGGNPTIGTSAGGLSLSPAGLPGLIVNAVASAVNYAVINQAAAGSAVSFVANGSDVDIPLYISSKGAQNVGVYTGGLSLPQVFVTHTASADRYITLTGANAANPKIATSAGSLDIGSPVVFTGQTVGTTVGATGAASALPANPLGYITTAINGTACKIPYYTA